MQTIYYRVYRPTGKDERVTSKKFDTEAEARAYAATYHDDEYPPRITEVVERDI